MEDRLNNEDTIAALSTPPGVGGIGVIRVSGSNAIDIADRIFSSKKGMPLCAARSHTVHYGFIIDKKNNETVDECLVTVMKSPLSYTREDTIEISCHGGYQTLARTLALLTENGARQANPGEFTLRAFLNGRIDLSQAEAVMDLISSKTDFSRKLALNQLEGSLGRKIEGLRDRVLEMAAFIEAHIDFPEDDLPKSDEAWFYSEGESIVETLNMLSRGFESGHLFREGITVAIVGKPNVGKSSLLNALLQRDRAIVTEIPGTTRDIIEEYVNIKGLPVRIIDTAGIRDCSELVEREGVRRSLDTIESAQVILAVFDVSSSMDLYDNGILDLLRGKKTLVAVNKIDLLEGDISPVRGFEDAPICYISALKAIGIEELKEALFRLIVGTSGVIERQDCLVTSERHRNLIEGAILSLTKALDLLRDKMPMEVAALYVREALDCLGQITGVVTTEDMLERIFSRFCIGK